MFVFSQQYYFNTLFFSFISITWPLISPKLTHPLFHQNSSFYFTFLFNANLIQYHQKLSCHRQVLFSLVSL